jgi:ribosomal protein S15P/S13E
MLWQHESAHKRKRKRLKKKHEKLYDTFSREVVMNFSKGSRELRKHMQEAYKDYQRQYRETSDEKKRRRLAKECMTLARVTREFSKELEILAKLTTE